MLIDDFLNNVHGIRIQSGDESISAGVNSITPEIATNLAIEYICKTIEERYGVNAEVKLSVVKTKNNDADEVGRPDNKSTVSLADLNVRSVDDITELVGRFNDVLFSDPDQEKTVITAYTMLSEYIREIDQDYDSNFIDEIKSSSALDLVCFYLLLRSMFCYRTACDFYAKEMNHALNNKYEDEMAYFIDGACQLIARKINEQQPRCTSDNEEKN